MLERCPDCGRTQGVDDEVSDTLALEATCPAEVVDLTPEAGDSRGSLTRTVPLRVQRQVFHEAGYRCAVPGCGGGLWLHLHHLQFWSRGGDHAPENLVCLCSHHHRAAHDGYFAIRRLDNGDLEFEQAHGRILVRPATHVGHGGGRAVA